MSISLVAGLGNPGRDYENTRHNLGFVVIEAFARKLGLSWKAQPAFEAQVARWDRSRGQTFILVKPLTFMNESGRALHALAGFYKVEPASITVLYDDLNIELGRVKITTSGSAGGHNGAASLLEHVGDGWIRFRLGVGPKEPPQIDLKDFVLGKFTPDQQRLVDQTLDHYLSGLTLLLESGVTRAMNSLNRKESK